MMSMDGMTQVETLPRIGNDSIGEASIGEDPRLAWCGNHLRWVKPQT